MQKQGFWVGLTRFELNEEIQKQNKIEDTLKEDNITEEKLNNSVIAKLMSVSYNIMQFVLDSALFNRIIFDVFKYCKINEQNRMIVVEMMETQIKGENIDYLKLDKEMLLSMSKNGEKKEEKKGVENNEGQSEPQIYRKRDPSHQRLAQPAAGGAGISPGGALHHLRHRAFVRVHPHRSPLSEPGLVLLPGPADRAPQ